MHKRVHCFKVAPSVLLVKRVRKINPITKSDTQMHMQTGPSAQLTRLRARKQKRDWPTDVSTITQRLVFDGSHSWFRVSSGGSASQLYPSVPADWHPPKLSNHIFISSSPNNCDADSAASKTARLLKRSALIEI